MREESQKSKLAKMSEDLEKAKYIVEECKRLLTEKKKQVEVWRNKVDRSCIERIRAFQNPPAMIGQIMEMMAVLIGKKKFPEIFINRSELLSSQLRDGKDEKQSESSKPSITKFVTRIFKFKKKLFFYEILKN